MNRTLLTAATFLLLTGACLILACQSGRPASFSIRQVAQSYELWTGVAVSKEGRIFVNYPRVTGAESASVAEIVDTHLVRPYPNEIWNMWDSSLSPKEHFVCVQSVYIDDENNLWILDPAFVRNKGVIRGGAKLVKVDLRANQITQVITFDSLTASPWSYLNDVRVDTKKQFAYITECFEGAIVAVDLATGRARRVLFDHPSTKAEDTTFVVEGITLKLKVGCDGLALDPGREYLYYQALTGHTMYRIKTESLRDFSLSEQELGGKVEVVAKTGIADGIEFGKDGSLYLTSLEHNAIRRLTPEGKVEVVVQDSALKWPDSFSVTAGGDIYVTTSQLHLGRGRTEPYRIFKLNVRD